MTLREALDVAHDCMTLADWATDELPRQQAVAVLARFKDRLGELEQVQKEIRLAALVSKPMNLMPELLGVWRDRIAAILGGE